MSDEQAPDQRLGNPRKVLLDVGVPQPMKSMAYNTWPALLLVLGGSYLFAVFFPALGGLLLIVTPVAVVAALVAAGIRARKIRLTVTEDVIAVSSGKSGIACDRSHVQSAVLVEDFVRRRLGPRTESLILLDRDGKTALMLYGLLWPPAVLQRVIALMPDVPLERIEGKQTPESLAVRYPNILQNTDGTESGRSRE